MWYETIGLILLAPPFFLGMLFFIISNSYAGKIHRIHPHLPLSGVEYCPICGERIVREKFTNNIFLFPYTFAALRHYERRHKEISKYARAFRLSFTLFVLLVIHSFAVAYAYSNTKTMVNQGLPWTEIVMHFLLLYSIVQLVIWSIIACILLRKKGEKYIPAEKHSRTGTGDS